MLGPFMPQRSRNEEAYMPYMVWHHAYATLICVHALNTIVS